MSYHLIRWTVEVFWTKAHSRDAQTRKQARELIKANIRALHSDRYK